MRRAHKPSCFFLKKMLAKVQKLSIDFKVRLIDKSKVRRIEFELKKERKGIFGVN